MVHLIGESACAARDALIRIFRESHRACVCVEGRGDCGKSRCIEEAVEAADCDLVRWEGDGGDSSSATTVSLHDACMKSILPHLLSSRQQQQKQQQKQQNQGDDKAGVGGGGGEGGRQLPITMLADNVHEAFYQNRTIIQLLARKAATFSGKRLPGRPNKSRCLQEQQLHDRRRHCHHQRPQQQPSGGCRSGGGGGRSRPLHLVMTYDPSKLEARIVSQLRNMATCPPVQVSHPRVDEAAEALTHMLMASPHFPTAQQQQQQTTTTTRDREKRRLRWRRVAELSLATAISSLSSSSSSSSAETTAAVPVRLVRRVWERLDMSLFAATLACDGCCDDEEAMADEAEAVVREDFAVDRDRTTQEEHCFADFGNVPAGFCYTGFKADSMVNCLRRSPLRIDAAADEGERRLACSVSEALLLSNVLVAGMRSDEDVDGRNMHAHAASSLYDIAAASCSTSRNDKNLGVL